MEHITHNNAAAAEDSFAAIAERFNLRFIIQFGSTAADTAGPMSDIDVLVYPQHPLSLAEEGALREALAEALGDTEDRIDLVNFFRASALLREQAFTHGKVLYGDPFAIQAARVRTWKALQDEKRFAAKRRAFLDKTFAK